MVEHGQNERASVLDTVALLTNVPSERLVSSNSWNEEQRCPGGVFRKSGPAAARRNQSEKCYADTICHRVSHAHGSDFRRAWAGHRARSPLSDDQVRRIL